MSATDGTYTFGSGDGAAATAMLDELADLHDIVHAGPDQELGTLFHRDSFLARTRGQVERPGFAIVWARAAGELVGYSYGLTLGPGQWWTGTSVDPPPAQILTADKFVVIELAVSPNWRGQGIGRRLLGELLAERREPYAALTTRPQSPARQMYARWGWHQIGRAQPTPDAPTMDQLVLPLRHIP